MEYALNDMTASHREAVIDIFNYFIENSFAAYPEKVVDYRFFDAFLRMSFGYPAIVVQKDGGDIVGFGFMSSFHHAETFNRTGVVTYFLLPDHTRQGIGRRILERFEKWAADNGVDSLVANISSLNPESIAFHEKHGFVECGRFRDVATKHGRDIDMVWVQKRLTGHGQGESAE